MQSGNKRTSFGANSFSPVSTKKHWGSPRGIMTFVLDCDFEVTDFKLQMRHYVHFLINTLGKGMNPLISPAMC